MLRGEPHSSLGRIPGDEHSSVRAEAVPQRASSSSRSIRFGEVSAVARIDEIARFAVGDVSGPAFVPVPISGRH